MTAFAKIPVTIVTGFLGAGKTTLIRHALQTAGDRRLALIVNEFGDVGVDGEILRACGVANCPDENIIELANGCICCTVADDFLPAIEALLAHPKRPDHIIVETSGLALPKPLIKAFDWPAVRAKLTVDGVVAVVDARAVADGRFADDEAAIAAERASDAAIDHDNPLEEVYEDQLLAADLIVLNKTDLVDSDTRARVAAEVADGVGRAVKVIATKHGKLAADVLLGLAAAAEDDLANRPSHHDAEPEHDHDDFDSFVVDVPELAEPFDLIDRLESAAERFDILRIKGFMAVADRPMRLLIQGVGNRFSHHFDRPWRAHEARAGRLVVIGQKGIDRAAVTAAIAAESVA